jgi:hypothetical protein
LFAPLNASFKISEITSIRLLLCLASIFYQLEAEAESLAIMR